MENPTRNFTILDVLKRRFHPRTPLHGDGKHRHGKQPPVNYRRTRQARRKAERQHRRFSRLCAAGKRHTFKGRV